MNHGRRVCLVLSGDVLARLILLLLISRAGHNDDTGSAWLSRIQDSRNLFPLLICRLPSLHSHPFSQDARALTRPRFALCPAPGPSFSSVCTMYLDGKRRSRQALGPLQPEPISASEPAGEGGMGQIAEAQSGRRGRSAGRRPPTNTFSAS